MKTPSKILVVCIALTIILSGFVALAGFAQATTATASQLEQIRGNCISLKNTLSQLHVSDALLRVNMGQRYDLMLTKLMSRFNTRATSNNFNIDGLAKVSGNYTATLDTFRLDYKTYEEHMVALIKIDCQTQPGVFYDSLLVARSDRARVYADVVKLNQQIDQYSSEIYWFEKYYQSKGSL
ncbi:MAG: hypothetical protein WCI79_00675 [Candidatus Saccharibacteria bacterium]